jgi:hypothetical protein
MAESKIRRKIVAQALTSANRWFVVAIRAAPQPGIVVPVQSAFTPT